MKKWLFAFSMAGLLALTGCSRPASEEETSPAETETVEEAPVEEETSGIKVIENVGPDKNRTVSLRIVDENNPALPGREAVKVRGIYISGPMAGSTELFQNILDSAAGTEINTVVIDFIRQILRQTRSTTTRSIRRRFIIRAKTHLTSTPVSISVALRQTAPI